MTLKPYEEVVETLSRARGVPPIETFNRIAGKPAWRLCEEINDNDVDFGLHKGFAVRSSSSAKLRIFAEGYYLRQVRKEYHNNGYVDDTVKPEAGSETIKLADRRNALNEPPLNAVIRLLAEEIQYFYTQDAILHNVSIGGERSVHRSSVYPGVISNTRIYRFELYLPERIHRGGLEFEDRGTTTTLKWIRK